MTKAYKNILTRDIVIRNFYMHELYTLIRTVYGEARGESLYGQSAIVNVILNRVQKQRKEWGLTVKEVCMKPKQFSFWDNPNVKLDVTIENNIPFILNIINAISNWQNGWDMVFGATHYHTKFVKPPWSIGHYPCEIIGNHLFYNDIF